MKFTTHCALAVLSLFFACSSRAQIITTFAGDHSLGTTVSGDYGPATGAGIDRPYGLATDAVGNVYIGTPFTIRKVDAAGIITTIAGIGTAGYTGDGGPATAAQIGNAYGLVVDAAGNIFMADIEFNVIRKINTSGIISTIAGTGTAGYSMDGGHAADSNLAHPTSVAVDGAGNVYFTEFTSRVRMVSPSGALSTVVGTGYPGYAGDGGPATNANLGFPYGLALDGAGNMYIADQLYNVVRKVNASGQISTAVGSYSLSGFGGYSGDGGAATQALLNKPQGIAVDAAGNLFISDYFNSVVRKVNTSGIITTYAGNGLAGYSGDGGPAPVARLDSNFNVTVDAIGRLYISDPYNYVVRRVDTTSDHFPTLVAATDTVGVCENTVMSLGSSLSVSDLDAGQTETWTILTAPQHGSLGGFSAVRASTGGVVTPTGLNYTPVSGYIGTDTFAVQISDGTSAVTAYRSVTVLPTNAGVITGTDTMCANTIVILSDSVMNGAWTSYDTTIAQVYYGYFALYVESFLPGTDTVFYTVTNGCGTYIASYAIDVLTQELCPLGVHTVVPTTEGMKVYPNPSTGTFTIEMPDGARSISITDMMGKTVATRNVSPGAAKQTIDLENIPAGNYIIRLTAGDKIYREHIAVW